MNNKDNREKSIMTYHINKHPIITKVILSFIIYIDFKRQYKFVRL
jgi:hypothetical protein